ncbi:DDE-type integrase/transposase/recombinase [Microbacterium sp. NRRL B-14842]
MSTMHRILREHDMAGERRRQASHPPRTRPELVATAPGQVWSWDITKLKGPERGVYYDLYVVLDIFSRFVVGWTIAARRDAEIAKNLLEHAHGHPWRAGGDPRRPRDLDDLQTGRSAARRPRGGQVAHPARTCRTTTLTARAAFKTLKYAPVFPERFGSLADAGAFAEQFFAYYNHEHRTAGSGCTPPPASTSAPPGRSAPSARPPWTRPTPPVRALRPPPTPGAQAARGRLDQPALTGGPSYRPPDGICLTRLDTFRFDYSPITESDRRFRGRMGPEWRSMSG